MQVAEKEACPKCQGKGYNSGSNRDGCWHSHCVDCNGTGKINKGMFNFPPKELYKQEHYVTITDLKRQKRLLLCC
jgi:RecJ-like exonuclease